MRVEDVPVYVVVAIAKKVMGQMPIYAIPIVAEGFTKAFNNITTEMLVKPLN